MTDKHTPKRKTCDDCEVNWDRKGNVKTVVLCPLHHAAPEMLKALERIGTYMREMKLRPTDRLAILDIMRPAIAQAKS